MPDAYLSDWSGAARSLPAKVRYAVRTAAPLIRRGRGRLSGSLPSGITSLDGVPTPATVRGVVRRPGKAVADGYFVAETRSEVDGTWKVENLPLDQRYDVICRMPGFNDLILSNISPVAY